MITFNTFVRSKNGLLTINEVKEDKINYGESITDKSHYNPQASSFISNQGYTNTKLLYHFPTGEDNGLNMALITNKNLDITEKEAVYNHLKTQTDKNINELIEQLEEDEQSDNDDIAVTNKKENSESNVE